MQFTASESGRLDAVIAAHDEHLSRSKIQKAVKDGCVTVNGHVVTKVSSQVCIKDTIVIANSQSPTPNPQIDPINQYLEVLYEDSAMMAINKPAGIAVHPGHALDEHEPTLLNGIHYLFQERNLPFSSDSTLVHRLDKPTTGCIVVAKDAESFRNLQQQFEDRTIEKLYLAVVYGVPEHTEATIDAPIGRNLTDRTKMSILKTSVSREAKTSYRVLDASDNVALLECTLHTGRTHQIRVHLSSIGHPILGDETYGSSQSKKLAEEFNVEGLCLHAWKMKFRSPADSQLHTVEAPIAATIVSACHTAGIQYF